MTKQQSQPNMQSLFGAKPPETFLGLEEIVPGEQVANRKPPDIVVVGAGCATPYQSVGPYCADAPNTIRAASGFPGQLGHYDFDLEGTVLLPETVALDAGNIEYSESDFAINRARIRRSVQQVLSSRAVPVVLGGDDSVPIPVLQAYEGHGPITVLQFDAHIDWRDEVGGEKMGLSSNMRRASEMPWVTRMIQLGARGIGSARPSDRQDALDWGVELYPMAGLVNGGLSEAIERIAPGSQVFINLDIDAMDPAVVPGVIGPAPGGFDYWQVVGALKAVAARAKVAGFSVVEFMPAADVNGRSALVIARLVAIVMGLISRQRVR